MQPFFSRYKNKFPQVGLAVVLGFVLLVENIAFMFFATQRLQQSSPLLSLYTLTICTILTIWVQYDARSLGISMGMDQSMYIFFGWPIMFPVYAFRSRGFRSGGLLLLSFLGIFVFTLIAAFAITIAINIGVAIFSAGQ
jgi:hypothetical protein